MGFAVRSFYRKSFSSFLEADNYFQYRYRRGGRQAEPLIIPDSQMEQFINAVKGSERPIYFTPQELNIDKGTRIRIHGGRLMELKAYL